MGRFDILVNQGKYRAEVLGCLKIIKVCVFFS